MRLASALVENYILTVKINYLSKIWFSDHSIANFIEYAIIYLRSKIGKLNV